MGNCEFDGLLQYKVLAIDLVSEDDRKKPIINYLGNPTGVTDRKIKYRALSYVIMGNKMLKKTHEGILLKCLGKSEVYLAISEVYKISCSSHQEGHKMKWILFRLGVY